MLEQVPIDELKPGMYVTQVLEQSGNLQIRSKGVVKSQSIIQTLKNKGILLLEVDLTKSKHFNDNSAGDINANTVEQAETSESVSASKPKPVGKDSISEASELYENALSI